MGNRSLARNKEVQKILGRKIQQEPIAREVVFQAQMTACEAQGSWVASGFNGTPGIRAVEAGSGCAASVS